MLVETLSVVFRPFASGVVAVVDGDMAVVTGGSGLDRRGWGLCWGAVDRPGGQWRRSRGAGGCSEAGEAVVVVVDDVVGVVDGGCADVVSGDVAGDSGGDGRSVASSRVVVCIRASTEVVEGWGTVSVDVPASLSGRGGSSQGAV